MPTRDLNKLFRPTSVAVIGASNRESSVGAVVMRNLLQGGFSGPIMPVNPKHKAVAGVLAYPDIPDLPLAPDLAVVALPPAEVPEAIDELGALGTRAAIVLTAGLSRATTGDGRTIQQAMLDAAAKHNMRILGPNCLGILVPGIGLNASFAHLPALPGRIAFVSQSGAMCTAVLDWARAHGIGFSHFVSLGDSAEIDFDDVIDYLGSDPNTRAILLYIESIHQRRNFMSAARAASRNKPVLAIKAGVVAEGAKAAASHTGALAGADDVFDAALKRAGILRVHNTGELFAAVETLARSRPPRGERLAILTNGGGIGVMAVDSLILQGGTLAELAPATIEKLDAVLPQTWSRGNPVDIIGDASGDRYAKALAVLLDAPEVDAVLVMHAPTAIVPPVEAAQTVIGLARERGKGTILTSWAGEEAAAPARRLFAEAGIPTYDTPHEAVTGFLHLVRHRKTQELLMETPPSLPTQFIPDHGAAHDTIGKHLAEQGAGMMGEYEAKAVLAAYGIPVVRTETARDTEEAVRLADEIGYPVAIKIRSPDVTHKSDVGGVVLNLDSAEAVRHAADIMLERIRVRLPQARIEGFTVQRMARQKRPHELIVGVATDPIFGPVILFGQGGTAVEVIADRAVGLPPLNMSLAHEMIARTRIHRLLRGYRDRPPADLDAIALTLVQVSQLVVDLPEIQELDINPLFADETGVLALDARIRVAPASAKSGERLAIRPYPQELEERYTLLNGREVLIRPIRPEDEPAHYEFMRKLTPEDIRFRFFGLVGQLPHTEMARLTQIDYDREMAFVATAPGPDGTPETLGVVRTVTDPDNTRAEFAIIVRSDLKGQHLGSKLLRKMVLYCRSRGTQEMVGQVLRDNSPMMTLIDSLGFTARHLPGEEAVEISLPLQTLPETFEREE